MRTRLVLSTISVALLMVTFGCTETEQYDWAVHDKNRPQPRIVNPGLASTQDQAGKAPSDAIVLFDGTDLSAWESDKGEPATWKVENGYIEIVGRTGSMRTKGSFGDCQLHIEWATPSVVKGNGQGRGNSGVYLMSKYEVQVLDSYNNMTYPDGQAGSLYGQSPPMVNASRSPGQWQSYDIIFRRPIFDGDKLVRPATMTVLHNGVLVQDHFTLQGISTHKKRATYRPHPDKLPISLQDHGNPTRYRNIWIRPLPEKQE